MLAVVEQNRVSSSLEENSAPLSQGGVVPEPGALQRCDRVSTEEGWQQNVWQTVQADFEAQLSPPSYRTWIRPLTLKRLTPDQVVLEAESAFNRDWILKHYRHTLAQAFAQAMGGAAPSIQVDIGALKTESLLVCEAVENETAEPAPTAFRPWTPRTQQCSLNPKYTFETFVVGGQNRFAYAAALAVAETPAHSYNPLFLYGCAGLGKTHLAQAIGHFTLLNHPDLAVRYVTAEQFTNELIAALGSRNMNAFRSRYRQIDLLVIDDVQFLEGKERTQEEVFHTFNTLHESGKQIVLTSDRSPKHLASLEDRLRSRFEWGLLADIQPPDLETRVTILHKKAEREHLFERLQLAPEVLVSVAEAYPHNVRELEGGLNKVAAYAMLTQTPLSPENVQTILGVRPDPGRLSYEAVLETVARYYHLRPSDLKGPCRAKDVAHARQVAIYILRELTGISFPKLGEVLGGRKHSTVLYSYEKLKDLLDNHPILAQQVKDLQQQVQA